MNNNLLPPHITLNMLNNFSLSENIFASPHSTIMFFAPSQMKFNLLLLLIFPEKFTTHKNLARNRRDLWNQWKRFVPNNGSIQNSWESWLEILKTFVLLTQETSDSAWGCRVFSLKWTKHGENSCSLFTLQMRMITKERIVVYGCFNTRITITTCSSMFINIKIRFVLITQQKLLSSK